MFGTSFQTYNVQRPILLILNNCISSDAN